MIFEPYCIICESGSKNAANLARCVIFGAPLEFRAVAY
jgi:hypothetical protein